MKITIFILAAALLLCFSANSAHADLLECDEKILPSLSELPIIGPKVAEAEDNEHKVGDFFKKIGCQIKKGAAQVSEKAKKLGTELKDSAKKFGEKAKDLGADLKEKFGDFKERFSSDTSDERVTAHKLISENVEIINPDMLKAEQQCGHGYILDALGNCSKLRK